MGSKVLITQFRYEFFYIAARFGDKIVMSLGSSG